MSKTKKILSKATTMVGMCLLLGVISAQAASLTVSTTADGGFGSLRQAIIDATTNAEANTVTFTVPMTDSGYDAVENRFTINLQSPLPPIPLAALIMNNDQPHGMTIRGNNTFRIFTLVNSAVVTMNNVTISNGFSDNGLGGGIFMGNSSTLSLNGCIVSDNNAFTSGGGIYMSNSGTLTLTNSTVRDNSAITGGGIYIFDSGTLNIITSTIHGNRASNGSSGGISAGTDASVGGVNDGSGGGVYNGTSGTINATNSTIDGNSASNSGGGIFNTATMTLTNNTITSNTAFKGGGLYNNFTATLNNNLVALNTATDGNDMVGRASLGNAYTGSYNLVGNADGSEGLGATTNQLGTTINPIDPRIGELRNNGGPTHTRAVHNRSPAIDKGNSPGIISDQRGEVRPYDNLLITNAPGGDGSDIGAFERTFTPTPFDFDADGKADQSVFRPSNAVWYILRSTLGFTTAEFGTSTDRIVPADFDGDGRTDIAVFSAGTWSWLNSSNGTLNVMQFGIAGDIPLPADYDGDGRAELAVYRGGVWFTLNHSNNQFQAVEFGRSTDRPVPADYDGDGLTDFAVYRDGAWHLLRSSQGPAEVPFGISSDQPTVADYDGDGKADQAVYRNGMWYVLRSTQGFYAVEFGVASDVPVAADYDGDGKTDIGVFRNGDWYLLRSQAGFDVVQFGTTNDSPIPAAFLP